MKSLRELADEYASSTIDRDTYRNSRRTLIKQICAGEVQAKVHEYLAPPKAPIDSIDQPIDYDITSRPTATQQTTSETLLNQLQLKLLNQRNILIGIGIAILLCGAILATLLLSSTEDKPIQNPQISHIPQWQNLIIEFIQQKNWDTNSMATFVASWQLLSEQQRKATKTSAEIKRLTNAIYQRLSDKHALLSLNDDTVVEKTIAEQQQLVDFAKQLGINDKRLIVLRLTSK